MNNKKPTGVDYLKLAEGIDNAREVVRALVAGLTDDGFSDEQARGIVAGFFALAAKHEDES